MTKDQMYGRCIELVLLAVSVLLNFGVLLYAAKQIGASRLASEATLVFQLENEGRQLKVSALGSPSYSKCAVGDLDAWKSCTVSEQIAASYWVEIIIQHYASFSDQRKITAIPTSAYSKSIADLCSYIRDPGPQSAWKEFIERKSRGHIVEQITLCLNPGDDQ